MESITSVSQQIALLLEKIQNNQKQKTTIKLKMEELHHQLNVLKEQYDTCDDHIRSAKHQITEYCDTSHLLVIK